MMDYLNNGNINNSVNYPKVDMGVCTKPRVAIFHENVANMISQFTQGIGELGININTMVNKSKGDIAYTMLDLESEVDEGLVKKLESIEGVFRVRVVRGNL